MGFFEDIDKTLNRAANIIYTPIRNTATSIENKAQEANKVLANNFDPANPFVRLGKDINEHTQGAAHLVAHPVSTTKQIVKSVPQQVESVKQFAKDPVGNTVNYFSDPYNKPLAPLDIALTAAGGVELAGAAGNIAKGAIKSTPKTITPQIPKTEIPIANTKPLPVQSKPVTQKVTPKAEPDVISAEDGLKILERDTPAYQDTPLVQYLKGEIPLEEIHQETLPYLVNEYSKTTGVPVADVIKDLENSLFIKDYMSSKGSYNRLSGDIKVRTRNRGEMYSEHSANPEYIDNVYDTLTHEYAHKLQNDLADWETIGALSDEGRAFANKYNLTLEDRPSENLSHAVSASGLPEVNLTPERIGVYGDYYLNPYDVADMHPIVQNSIRDYIINRDMPSVDPVIRDINAKLNQILNEKGIQYQPNMKAQRVEFEPAPENLRLLDELEEMFKNQGVNN